MGPDEALPQGQGLCGLQAPRTIPGHTVRAQEVLRDQTELHVAVEGGGLPAPCHPRPASPAATCDGRRPNGTPVPSPRLSG